MNLQAPNFSVKWLSSFLAVEEFKSVVYAAQNLDLHPNSLIRNIDELENKLALRLFVRHHRNDYELTPDGLAFSLALRPLMQSLRLLEQNTLSTLQTEPVELKLGLVGIWASFLMRPLLEKLYQTYPVLSPYIRQILSTSELEAAFNHQEFLLGVCSSPPQNPAIRFTSGPPIPYVIVGAEAGSQHKKWSDYFYIRTPAHIEPHILDGPWDDQKYPRQTIMETDHFGSVLNICHSGLAVAWLPLCLVSGLLASQKLHVVTEPPQTVYLTPHLWWHQEAEEIPALTQAIESLQNLFISELAP